MFRHAPQPDIVRSLQKDEYTQQLLREQTHAVISSWSSNSNFNTRYEQEIDLLANAAYYSVTTLIGKTTLGEEYCDLLQVRQVDIGHKINSATTLSSNPQPQAIATAAAASAIESSTPATLAAPALAVDSSTPTASPSDSAESSSATAITTAAAAVSPPQRQSLPPIHIPVTTLRLLNIPQRTALVVLQVFLPYLYLKLRKQIRSLGQQYTAGHSLINNTTTGVAAFFSRLYHRIRSYCVSLLLSADSHVQSLQKLHLAVFYLHGAYLECSKRLCAVQYIIVRQLDNNSSEPSYGLLGVLIGTQMAITVTRAVMYATHEAYTEWRTGRQQQQLQREQRLMQLDGDGNNSNITSAIEGDDHPRVTDHSAATATAAAAAAADDSDGEESDAPACTLCLSPCDTDVTVTECGHLYHWQCICEALNNKSECPLCRQSCSHNTLIVLAHYI